MIGLIVAVVVTVAVVVEVAVLVAVAVVVAVAVAVVVAVTVAGADSSAQPHAKSALSTKIRLTLNKIILLIIIFPSSILENIAFGFSLIIERTLSPPNISNYIYLISILTL